MQKRYAGYSGHPYWPPGPSETEEWQRILEQRPDLAPAVEKEAQPELCRMVDGSADWLESANAYRSERLQALGNGVFPLTGAIALKVLWERLVDQLEQTEEQIEDANG